MAIDLPDASRSPARTSRTECPAIFTSPGGRVKRNGSTVGSRGQALSLITGDTVLAKHDETYMPKDVADALKKQGHWKDEYGKGGAASTTSQGASR